jgi:hypothetical protein
MSTTTHNDTHLAHQRAGRRWRERKRLGVDSEHACIAERVQLLETDRLELLLELVW